MRGSAGQKKIVYENDAIVFSRTSNQFTREAGNDSLSKTGKPLAEPVVYLFVVKTVRFWTKKSRNLLIKHKKTTYTYATLRHMTAATIVSRKTDDLFTDKLSTN